MRREFSYCDFDVDGDLPIDAVGDDDPADRVNLGQMLSADRGTAWDEWVGEFGDDDT
jgi:hypothetical protein